MSKLYVFDRALYLAWKSSGTLVTLITRMSAGKKELTALLNLSAGGEEFAL